MIGQPPALDDLTEEQRIAVQLEQADNMTLNGHIRSKLKIMRDRLRKTYVDNDQLPADSAEAADDMQLLMRDAQFITPAQPAAAPKSKWPAIALAAALGVPATTAIFMAPKIISAFQPPAPIAQPNPQFVPILVPGKPGVK